MKFSSLLFFIKMNFGTLVKYINTVRYLKMSQVLYRMWYGFRSLRSWRPEEHDLVPAIRKRKFVIPCEKYSSCSDGIVNVLNREIDVFSDGWVPSSLTKLEIYNVNYFDFLFGSECRSTDDLMIQAWIDSGLTFSSFANDAYPLSLRLVNWIKWGLVTNTDLEFCRDSLSNQVQWLLKNIEYGILGNHVFSNAKALMFFGKYWNGELAAQCTALGEKIFLKEVDEQILVDGANFELSPMYHGIMLEDLLDLYNLYVVFGSSSDESILRVIRKKIELMTSWLYRVTPPDGSYAFFNDSVDGVAVSFQGLIKYMRHLGISYDTDAGSCHMPFSGYCRLENNKMVVLCDGANVGPDYIPGHAHADTLSFEMWLNREKVIVNSGISQYGVSVERLRQRGTLAHNTVSLDGMNSTEVWSGFRVARRAEILNTKFTEVPLSFMAEHDGYKKQGVNSTHKRTWCLSANRLSINDVISSSSEIKFEARFHFHPDLVLYLHEVNRVRVSKDSAHLCDFVVDQSFEINIINTSYHPQFNIQLENQCVSVKGLVQGVRLIKYGVEF